MPTLSVSVPPRPTMTSVETLAKHVDAPARPKRAARRQLGARLVERGLLTEEQLQAALDRQAKDGGLLGHIIITMGLVPPVQVGQTLAEVTGIPYIDIVAYTDEAETARLLPTTARLLPESMIRTRLVLPLRADAENVWLAMADPLDLDVIDAVGLQTGRRVIPLLSLQTELLPIVNRLFDVRERAEEVMREIEQPQQTPEETAATELAEEAVDAAPLVRLVNTIIDGAFDNGASDIHLEPQEDGMRVRYRTDGVLHEQTMIPRGSMGALISRIKVIGGMDIAEKRRPQDGRIARRMQGRSFDLRVSTMPTVWGEKAVLRVLDKSAMNVPLANVGFLQDELEKWEHLITRPYGMVLVTGPTGSGKSTTLYASLNHINDPGKNIATVEDPVEYQLKGINQTQVNVRAGVTFAAGLRTLVRQDPDIILVGEVRDKETSEVAINAALTGHLVFATLHTNDAAGAMIRLDNMGVEPFLVASSLQGVVGQRLLRKICSVCKEWYTPEPELVKSLGLEPEDKDGNPIKFARGRGCRECGGKGYRGRAAVFEVLVMNEALRVLTLRREGSNIIKEQAIKDGMRPMRGSAMQKVLMGLTTPEEVSRVILEEGE